LRTWIIELTVVATILVGVSASLGASAPLEWLGSLAVLATFAHAQVGTRLAERQAERTTPDVPCYRWLLFYWCLKEGFWFAYFVLHHSYAALVGVIVFLLYPIWRRWYRKFKANG